MANLFSVLRDFNFNLDVINVSGNNFGNHGVACMINGITGINYQTLYSAANGWKPCKSPDLKITQSVVFINFANNNIGDDGAKTIADALVSGKLPSTKVIDLHGNNFTEEGNKHFAQLAKNIQQPIKIVVDTLFDGLKKQGILAIGTKEQKQGIITDWLNKAQANGVDVKNVTVSKNIWDMLENSINITGNFLFGWAKCSVVPRDIKSFAADQIIATASKKAEIVNTALNVVTCYFETFDETAASEPGIQYITNIGLIEQSELLGVVE